jgi:hypothetical protein
MILAQSSLESPASMNGKTFVIQCVRLDLHPTDFVHADTPQASDPVLVLAIAQDFTYFLFQRFYLHSLVH